MWRALFYFVLFFLMVACHSKTSNSKQNSLLDERATILYNDLSAIHDTAMLLMGPIAGIKSQLRDKMSSLPSQKDRILVCLSDLKKAEDWMMRWMNEFKNVELEETFYISQTKDSILGYLEAERIKVVALHSFMQSSLSKAKQLNRSIGNF